MRCLIHIGSLCIFAPAILGIPSHALSAQSEPVPEPPRVLPIPPKDVFALLPATPRNWKITSSIATNQIGTWMVTLAERRIESVPDLTSSSVAANVKRLQPMRTIFTLIDTGLDPPSMGAFADFKVGRQGNSEKLFMKPYPAILTRSSANERLQLLINNRFVLTIETQNQKGNAVLGWAQLIPFDRYNVPSGALITKLPLHVVVSTIDELHPTTNHDSPISIATPTPSKPQ